MGSAREMVIHFQRLVDEFSFFENNRLNSSIDGNVAAHIEKWTPPPNGWLKGILDAAFSEGRAASALVLRNSKEDIVRISSETLSFESAFIAEFLTLKWDV